ncbi:MAG: FG-GAP-like repeat-containing protein, partial [Promethearchaeota archaeon]
MNPEYQNTYWYEPIYDAIDSYMVATYPTVSRVDFSLMKSTDNDFLNFGFNVEESWNTDEDLNDWTLSIASGDIDGDGKGEIIVGDYDNNVYIFENMVNNTYKRMYETFDLTHEEECTQSPYLYQELEGISGEFMRKIWDHAEHLLVDVDLDQDGLKEMIIATNLQIYVFEDKNLTGGDELQFIYSFDLRDSAFNGQQGWDEVNSISAMTFGKDLDYDGRLELIVAAGPFLWCFNVGEENYEGTEYNGFFITDPSLDGRYDLLGNPLADPDYQYAIINALISGDTDQDGWPEIILAGTLDSRAIKKDGFLFIYECEGGIFKKVWEAPDNVTHWNPITSIKIDDQDYDGAQEIIFGHSFGFDIWEWIQGSDSEYRQVEYVTASANYPNIPLSLRSMPVNFRKDYADMALGQGSMAKKVMHVYTNMSRISYAIYDETTQTWMEYGSVVPATYNNLGTIDYETTPSVCSASDGTFYAIWRVFPVSGNPSIYAAYYIPATQTWTTPVEQIFGAIFGYQDLYPDIAQYDSSNMVIIFTWDRGGGGISDLFYEVTAMNLPGTFTKSGEIKFDHFDEVHVQSSSIQRLSDGTFVIAFAAINNYLGKPDYDIWSIHLNATFSYENVAIHQITNSYEDELGPNLALLQSEDNSLVVTYENMQSVYEDRIGVCASKDYGRNWGRPHTLNDLGPNILRVEYPEYNYIRYEFGGGIVDPMPTIFGICIAGLSAEGFIYTFTYISRYWEYHIIDNPFWQGFQYVGINLQSDWTGNNLWNVEDLDVGDTDGDNRREVCAGWEDEVSIYELKSSNDGNQIMTYEETWLSDPLPNSFTAITVYDSNGNGFDEIGVATKHGNVYLMEYPDPSQGSNHLINGEERWNNSQTTYSSLFGLLSGDFDSDGKDEIISLGETPYEIIAFDDDGSILWNNSDNSYQWTWTGLHDLNNDSIPELIACDYDHSIFVFNTLTGTQLWNYSIPSIPNEHIDDFDVADIDNDGLVEVVCGSTNGSLWLFEANGTLIQQISGVASNGIIDIRLGDFYHNNETLVAFNDESGKLRVVYPLNGTIVYESPTFFITMWSTILNYDFNGDGVDELIFGYDKLHILDLVSGELIYNSSDLGGFMWFNMYLKDFDDDGNLEVLFLTTNNQVILEDLSSHQRQWTYSPTNGNIKDIEIGKLGGSGLWDVALVSSNGLITAINGKNGMPIWFTYEPEQVDSVVCADIDGLGHDSIVYWLHNSYKIAAWDGIVPTYISPSPKIVPRAYYYGIQTPSDVNGIWLQDIDNNKIDEIFYNVGDHHIY